MTKELWLIIVSFFGLDVKKAESAFDDQNRRIQIINYLQNMIPKQENVHEQSTEENIWLQYLDSTVIRALVEAGLEDNGLQFIRSVLSDRKNWFKESNLEVVLFIADILMKDSELASQIKSALTSLRECRYHLWVAADQVEHM